jgi:histidine phosphotransferase ChpT
MSASETKLMELLCTRLCHDITGPVGAIANGAEFLAEEDTGMQGQAIELITQSASEAVNRLQFYRMAYGRVGAKGEANIADCKEIIKKFFENGKISLDWPDHYTEAANVPITRNMARLIYNLVIMAAGTLIRGGVVSIRLTKDESENAVVSIAANGMTIKWDEKVEKALRKTVKVDELEAATVQAYFSGMIAKEANVTLQIEQGTENFEIKATQQQEALVN